MDSVCFSHNNSAARQSLQYLRMDVSLHEEMWEGGGGRGIKKRGIQGIFFGFYYFFWRVKMYYLFIYKCICKKQLNYSCFPYINLVTSIMYL